MITQIKKRIIQISWVGAVIMALCLLCFVQGIYAQETIKKEIVIKVKPNIIVLGEGEAAKIPIRAARVCSTELRELNQKYNAKRIEKLYKINEKANKGRSTKVEGSLVSKEKEGKATVDLSRIFTKEAKRGLFDNGEEIVELEEIFLIQFALEPDIDINALVSDYRALEVVTYAKHIVRRR